MDTFDFILDNEQTTIDTPSPPSEYVGPNLNQIIKMTRKKFGQDILEVYRKLGGADWLFTQAEADPKAFFELLKKMIPNPTIADAIADITVKLIDRYEANCNTPKQIATGGSHDDPIIIERYDDEKT